MDMLGKCWFNLGDNHQKTGYAWLLPVNVGSS
jgi:hypothetical protein